jgi:hypothetical protein
MTIEMMKNLQKTSVVMHPLGVILKVLPTGRPSPNSSLPYFPLYRATAGIQFLPLAFMQATTVTVFLLRE